MLQEKPAKKFEIQKGTKIEQKNMSKSIRISERVYYYINEYEGNGFNEKFSNIITHAMESEKKLEKRLDDLRAYIRLEETKLNELKQEIYDNKDVIKKLQGVQTYIDSLIPEGFVPEGIDR